jgi:hypothetical protein
MSDPHRIISACVCPVPWELVSSKQKKSPKKNEKMTRGVRKKIHPPFKKKCGKSFRLDSSFST